MKVLADFVRQLTGIISVYKVLLYGSYAKGTWKKDSDIDIAVFIPNEVLISHRDIFRKISSLAGSFDYDIQAQVFSETEYHNPVGIVEEIVVYGLEIKV